MVKFLVLGGFPFWILFEYCGGYLLRNVFFPRVDIIDPSAPSSLHVQKLGYELFSDNHFDAKDIRNNTMVVAICKSPKFLNEEGVDKTIEPLEIISLTLFLKF